MLLPRWMALWTFIAAAAAPAPVPAQAISPAGYTCRFAKIPVRDGVHLYTSICEPARPHYPLPFLVQRTPYSVAADTAVRPDYRFLAADGYIFVYQDIRGRFGSEGQFHAAGILEPVRQPERPLVEEVVSHPGVGHRRLG